MPYLKPIIAGPFGTVSYLVGSDDSDEAVLIDAPPDCRAEVTRTLAADGRKLSALLITHPHFDHTLDAAVFAAEGVPVFAHADAEDGIRHPDTLGLIPHPPTGLPEGTEILFLAGGDETKAAGLSFRCFDVPGHSPGSLAFLAQDLEACFVGDVIFRGSVGRTDLPGGDFDRLAESIQNTLYALDDGVVLYPGHGPSTTVGQEKRSNPFVRG
jgi:hydroxyacylglutathione hydrolase